MEYHQIFPGLLKYPWWISPLHSEERRRSLANSFSFNFAKAAKSQVGASKVRDEIEFLFVLEAENFWLVVTTAPQKIMQARSRTVNINRHLISLWGTYLRFPAENVRHPRNFLSIAFDNEQRCSYPAGYSLYLWRFRRCYRYLETNSCHDALGNKSLSRWYHRRNVTCRFVVESVYSNRRIDLLVSVRAFTNLLFTNTKWINDFACNRHFCVTENSQHLKSNRFSEVTNTLHRVSRFRSMSRSWIRDLEEEAFRLFYEMLNDDLENRHRDLFFFFLEIRVRD